MIDWVIGRFSADEMKTAEKAFSLAAEAVDYILSRGEEAAYKRVLTAKPRTDLLTGKENARWGLS